MESLFWADQIAREVLTRKKMHYRDASVPRLKKHTVKTSASLSGVLHIGRLSDTIRSEAVFRALKETGVKAELIWVAENMDPLRKVPKGVPQKFKDYLGFPVTDIPDPDGCHRSYADHHTAFYFEVVDTFVASKMTKYSMREEYKKGSFKLFIKAFLEKLDLVIEIQNKFRTNPLKPGWSPWIPLCRECGKIITPHITGFERGRVLYHCQDYSFEQTKALGCGYKGENDPLKGEGKLLWKSEWAAQWAHWKVVSEGAGKEYQVPMSAWWVNGELCERVLGWPMPVPIFYEHLMIDGEKMSASKGNIIFPKDWLAVADPELLRYFYFKRIMKTRSFSWSSLPQLYDEYQKASRVYFDDIHLKNEREASQTKRLYEMAQLKKPIKTATVPFDFAFMVSQITPSFEKALKIFETTGHIAKTTKKDQESLKQLFEYAKAWAPHAPEEMTIRLHTSIPPAIQKSLSTKQKTALKELASLLQKKKTAEQLHNALWDIVKNNGLEPKEFFSAVYLALIGKERGPRLAPFILAVGKENVLSILKKI